VYIGDFYNQAVIHNDTRGPDHNRVNAAVRPDRDHFFGRIWRLDHKQAKKSAAPDLAKAGAADLAKALENANRPVRMNASRLLIEKGATVASAVTPILSSASPDARIAALWTLHRVGALGEKIPATLLADKDASVRRNVANVLEEMGDTNATASTLARRFRCGSSSRGSPRTRCGKLNDAGAKAIIAAWPKLDDDFQRSAAIGAASRNATVAISAALDSGDASLTPLVGQLAQAIGEKNDAEAASKLIVALAAKPAKSDALKRSILDTLGKSLKAAPAMTPELTRALGQLLGGGAAGSVLPLAAKWDKAGSLKPEIEKQTRELFAKLNTGSTTSAPLPRRDCSAFVVWFPMRSRP
jgi:hypothetical protein